MEFMGGGCLNNVLLSPEEITWATGIQIALDLANALNYMHTEFHVPLAHLDVKSPNVMLTAAISNFGKASGRNDHNNVLSKLADFGTARFITAPLSGVLVDNPTWQAPEIGETEYNHTVDTYAFGMVCWEIGSREQPWKNVSFMTDVKVLTLAGKRPEISPEVRTELREVIEKCWAQNPSSRPQWEWVIDKLKTLHSLAIKLSDTIPTQSFRTKLQEQTAINNTSNNTTTSSINSTPPISSHKSSSASATNSRTNSMNKRDSFDEDDKTNTDVPHVIRRAGPPAVSVTPLKRLTREQDSESEESEVYRPPKLTRAGSDPEKISQGRINMAKDSGAPNKGSSSRNLLTSFPPKEKDDILSKKNIKTKRKKMESYILLLLPP